MCQYDRQPGQQFNSASHFNMTLDWKTQHTISSTLLESVACCFKQNLYYLFIINFTSCCHENSAYQLAVTIWQLFHCVINTVFYMILYMLICHLAFFNFVPYSIPASLHCSSTIGFMVANTINISQCTSFKHTSKSWNCFTWRSTHLWEKTKSLSTH